MRPKTSGFLLEDIRTLATRALPADSLVLVTARLPNATLHEDLLQRQAAGAKIEVARIGDCEAPAAIFAAVYSGHRFAREFDCQGTQFRRERIDLDAQ